MNVTLETARLRLRPFRLDDAEAMFAGWTGDDEVTKYQIGRASCRERV